MEDVNLARRLLQQKRCAILTYAQKICVVYASSAKALSVARRGGDRKHGQSVIMSGMIHRIYLVASWLEQTAVLGSPSVNSNLLEQRQISALPKQVAQVFFTIQVKTIALLGMDVSHLARTH
jgi:hypothetical protein